MKIDEMIIEYEKIMNMLDSYNYALSVIYFDNSTIAPKDSLDEKASYIGNLTTAFYDIVRSDKYKEIIYYLFEHKDELKNDLKREIELSKKNLDKIVKIPSELLEEESILTAKTYNVWLDAKYNNNYNQFAPNFKRLIEIRKEIALLQGAKKDNIYNYYLDEFEEGITTDILDEFFNALKERISLILQKISKSNVEIDDSFANTKVSHQKQMEVTKYLLNYIGFDFNKGVISETEHPFCATISNNDIRIATHIYENMFFSNIFSTIHEGGHAIYDQNLSPTLKSSILREGTSMAIHESQSRFYENVIGRSFEFIDAISGKILSLFKSDRTLESKDLFLACNKVTPSLIRIEADELTYSLHIMIRYEMEKLILNTDVDVYELPAIWNRLYKEYLGVDVPSDTLGILQDSHWSSGTFGYFPSYALGNAYSLQFLNTLSKEIDIKEAIRNNQIKKINKWFKDNVYIYGRRVSPSELIKLVTKEELNPKYYLNYLEDRFFNIYKIRKQRS